MGKPQLPDKEKRKAAPADAAAAEDKRRWHNPVLAGRTAQQSKETHDLGQGWVKYTTLGLEMGVVIAAFVLAGVLADKHTAMRFPLFTIVGIAVGLTVAMIRLVKVSNMP